MPGTIGPGPRVERVLSSNIYRLRYAPLYAANLLTANLVCACVRAAHGRGPRRPGLTRNAVRRDRRKRRMTESDARPARFSVLSPRVPSDVRVTYYIYIRPGMVHGIMPVKAGYVYDKT